MLLFQATLSLVSLWLLQLLSFSSTDLPLPVLGWTNVETFDFNGTIQLLEYAISPCALLSVTKIQIASPLAVFFKHGQLYFSKASSSISDFLALIFPENSINSISSYFTMKFLDVLASLAFKLSLSQCEWVSK